jgi:hypothetical protein
MQLTPIEKVIVTNPAFLPAINKLADMLSRDRAIVMLRSFNSYLNAIPDGGAEPAIECAIGIAIASLHVTWQTPLFLSDELFDAMAVTGGECAECPACGYRQAAGYSPSCAVCGVTVGEPGIFQQERQRLASGAAWN